MLKKTLAVIFASAALTACAANEEPRIVQPSASSQEIQLTSGIATQIELPDGEHARSVTTGNPALVTAEQSGNIVSLIPKEGTGETNLIVRGVDEDGRAKVYQYRLIVEGK